jgi:hypothetical protein
MLHYATICKDIFKKSPPKYVMLKKIPQKKSFYNV